MVSAPADTRIPADTRTQEAIRSDLCTIRNKLEELQAEAAELGDDYLANAIEDIAAQTAELENDA